MVPAAPLDAASRFSRYARRLLDRDPHLLEPERLGHAFDADRMRAELEAAAPADESALKRALRQLRSRVMLHTIARDLAGPGHLEDVMAAMTALAETTIAFALERLDGWQAATYGIPVDRDGRRQQLMVVGMGKLGGGELNVSSDVDLIYVYPEDCETRGGRVISTHEYFTRLGRKLIGALSEVTEDGFVFRVDMRLRPYGESGPLAVSLDMLEEYFTAQGRAWERYAWVKGRALTGDRIPELDALIRPFVYRRHLDFSAIQSMRELHGQVASEVRRRDIADNIKLGPGGIREIEFTAQVFQLIRGGRDAGLRVRSTRTALRALADRGLLPADAVGELLDAYRFLRDLEHRLQYLDDQQTQALPQDDGDRDRVAESMGCADYAALLSRLDEFRARVSRHFGAIFAGAGQGEGDPLDAALRGSDNGEAEAVMAGLGYRDGAQALVRLQSMRGSVRFQRMGGQAQARVDQLLPRMVRAAARHPAPDDTLERLLRIVESIGRRESYIALLVEYPQALSSVARLVSQSPWACDYLARHPMLLDELIDIQQLQEPDWSAVEARLVDDLTAADGNHEVQLDLLRHCRHTQTFRLLALDLAGSVTLERLSDHLSDLATMLLRQVLRITWARMPTRHRDEPRFAVVAYGKLGGKELGYESDLDIIFLYDDEAPEASENYARLAQRMNGALTSHTGAGLLYETDLRLRPDGASGLLVSRIEAFETYQRGSAWPWEHQALTRARFVAGDGVLGQRFEALRNEILRLPRSADALRGDVRAMRQKMRDGHPNTSGLFDVKHDPGGIVDVEFAVQYLVLAHAADHDALTGNVGNIALLKLTESLGLLPRGIGTAAADAYRAYRRRQHALRLRGDRYARVAPDELAEERSAVLGLWTTVFGD